MKMINNLWLIDDDILFRFCIEAIVKENSFVKTLNLISSASDAIQKLKDASVSPDHKMPDLIFVDLNMPVMNGWEFIETVIGLNLIDHNQTMIYILSSSLDPRDFERAKSYAQITGFVPKPLTVDNFKALIDEVKTKRESIS
jgi:DNA-binding NarL/FixJ family response regulator